MKTSVIETKAPSVPRAHPGGPHVGQWRRHSVLPLLPTWATTNPTTL